MNAVTISNTNSQHEKDALKEEFIKRMYEARDEAYYLRNNVQRHENDSVVARVIGSIVHSSSLLSGGVIPTALIYSAFTKK